MHVQKLTVPQGRVIDAIDVYVEDLHAHAPIKGSSSAELTLYTFPLASTASDTEAMCKCIVASAPVICFSPATSPKGRVPDYGIPAHFISRKKAHGRIALGRTGVLRGL